MADEFARIDRIAEILRAPERASVLVGIGDDAAVLAPTSASTVLTVDASVEDVHFRRAWMSFADIGYRATVAAASDVLAMNARPTVAVAAWMLPGDLDEEAIDAIARGQRAAADALGMAFVGGNLARGPCLSITTTVLGTTMRAATRSGARPGQTLAIAGVLGEASLGLRALLADRAAEAPRAVRAFRRPQVLVAVDLDRAAAAVDVSDGLAQDVGHLARESGVRAILDVSALARRRTIADEARALGVDPLECELSGGEDYALVAAFDEVPPGFDAIGRLEAGQGVELTEHGVRRAAPEGFRHR